MSDDHAAHELDAGDRPRSTESISDVGVIVESEYGIGLGHGPGQLVTVALCQHPTATTACARPAFLRSLAASSVSIESFLAASMKPQVLTISASAALGRPPA